MANNEDSLVHELMNDLRERKSMSFIYKLHGGPFQPGLPDLLVAQERGAALVEAKWASDADFEKPLLEACASKLTTKQSLNLGALGVLDGPLRARVLIGGEILHDSLPGGGKGVICVAYDIADGMKLREFASITLLEIAIYLMDLRNGEKSTLSCAHLIQSQIKARGESWMAGHLLIGPRYFGPIKASTDKEKCFEDA